MTKLNIEPLETYIERGNPGMRARGIQPEPLSQNTGSFPERNEEREM